MQDRPHYKKSINRGFDSHRIVALLGPRQCGKTTLARLYCKNAPDFAPSQYFDLEKPQDIERLQNAYLTLSRLSGLVVIDEIQRYPNIFPILRVVHDELPSLRFLILGSASRELIQQSSESLAGRIYYNEITPFSLGEVDDWQLAWKRGGFPRSYLANTNQSSIDWRQNYIRTFLEQDIPNLGFNLPANMLQRFWMMLTHFHGQIINTAQIGQNLGISHQTARRYIDILHDTFMVRVLQPWHNNLGKRQVKSPKIYFRDSGLFHSLARIAHEDAWQTSPFLGASWEGFALEETIRHLQADATDCHFWRTHSGAELDLFIHHQNKRLGFEFKYADQPKITKSAHIAITDLQLDHLYIIHPGTTSWPIQDNVDVVGLCQLAQYLP